MATERIDALAFEPQFVDHAAPVWRALPAAAQGRFITDVALADRAAAAGIEAELLEVGEIRRRSLPPTAKPGPGPLAFVVSIGDMKIGRRLGYRRFVFMEHGAGQSYNGERGSGVRHPSYAGGFDREDVELFLVPNEYAAAQWRSAYPDARVEVVGSPRLAELPAREPGPGPVVAISFHWPAHVSPEADTALGHYFLVLPALAKAFTVIGHAHPKGDWQERMARYYRRAGIELVPDFDDVCRRADVYVCDNSSTIFEFAATGRPVVLLNAPGYRRHISHGGRFWDWADVGIQVDDPDQLIPAIAEALEDAPARREARQRTVELVYAHRDGSAAQRAVAAILELMGPAAGGLVSGARPYLVGETGPEIVVPDRAGWVMPAGRTA